MIENKTPSQEIIESAFKKAGFKTSDVPDTIYHYTSLEAFNGILFGNGYHFIAAGNTNSALFTNRDDTITLHFSHFRHLNDPTEVLYSLKSFNKTTARLLNEINQLYTNHDPQYKIHKTISSFDLLDKLQAHLIVRFTPDEDARECFKSYKIRNPTKEGGQKQIEEAINKSRSAIFLSSFATSGENERMWCDYAQGGRGVCVAFNTSKLLKELPNIPLQLVRAIAYFEEVEIDKKIEQYLRTIIYGISKYHTQNGNLNALLQVTEDGSFDLFSLAALKLVEIFSTIKNPDWKYEDEVRVLWPRFKSEHIHDVQYRFSESGVVKPFIPVAFPKDVIVDIIPGHKCDESTRHALTLMKKTKGLNLPSIG